MFLKWLSIAIRSVCVAEIERSAAPAPISPSNHPLEPTETHDPHLDAFIRDQHASRFYAKAGVGQAPKLSLDDCTIGPRDHAGFQA